MYVIVVVAVIAVMMPSTRNSAGEETKGALAFGRAAMKVMVAMLVPDKNASLPLLPLPIP